MQKCNCRIRDGTFELKTLNFFGGLYEMHSDGVVRKYYVFAEMTFAMRAYDPSTSAWSMNYFLTDHLGSTLAVLDEAGGVLEQQRYLPFGGVRELSGYSAIGLTDFSYTSQRANIM